MRNKCMAVPNNLFLDIKLWIADFCDMSEKWMDRRGNNTQGE